MSEQTHPYIFAGLSETKKIINTPYKYLDVDKLEKLVGIYEFYELTDIQLKSALKTRQIAECRQLMIFVLVKYYKFTYSNSGDYFNRTHGTCVYAVNNIQALFEIDCKFKLKITDLFKKVDLPLSLFGLKYNA